MRRDYIDIDDFGIKEIRCMNCGVTVTDRTYLKMPSKTEPGKFENVLVMKRHSTWAQIKVDLDDGTYAEPIVCKECSVIDVDLDEIDRQMKVGWEKELRHSGRERGEIEKHKDRVNKIKIKGRTK